MYLVVVIIKELIKHTIMTFNQKFQIAHQIVVSEFLNTCVQNGATIEQARAEMMRNKEEIAARIESLIK